jgi:peptidoglycan/LPS O-acetylase OafA/YrhL
MARSPKHRKENYRRQSRLEQNMTKFRSDVEGLRAIAVLPVILFHYGFGFSGGFIGVDIFFVISGFLITSLLIKDHTGVGISLSDFWERRVRRIFPALSVMIIISALAGWWILLPEDFMRFGRSLVSQMYFGSNFYFYLHTGYFDPVAESQPFLHTWSLAVEEQFYLFFPLLLLTIRRLRLPLKTTLVSIGAVSLLLSILLTPRHPSASFYLLHTRAWELIIGALLATSRADRIPRPMAELSSALGLGCIASAMFIFDAKTIFPGAAALLPCIGAALIIQGEAAKQTFISRLLSLPPLTFTGRLSYSLYLWHWPPIVFSRYWTIEPLSTVHRLGLLCAVFVISWASWKFVETPFRRRAAAAKRGALFSTAAVCSACLLAAGLIVANLRGVPSRFPASIHRYLDVVREWKLPHNRELTMSAAQNGAFFSVGNASDIHPSFLLWGDSHAMSVIPVLEQMANERHIRGLAATHASAPPLLGFYCAGRTGGMGEQTIAYNDAIFDQMRYFKIRNVLLVGYWSFYQDDAFTREEGPLHGPREAARGFDSSVNQTVKSLQALGCNVFIMLEVPDQYFDAPKRLAKAALRRDDLQQIGRSTADYSREMKRYRELFATGGATVLDASAAFTNSVGRCQIEREGECLYRDNSHLSIAGAMLLRPVFEPFFSAIK